MCGIYGEFFHKKSLTDKKAFLIENDKNINRGPDMQGYWTNSENCQLGFRRLSILDLSEKGNQPMTSLNGRYAIVFNGEIYNYLELKAQLINKGYHFKTTTDTEVLVNYFECFGIEKTLDIIDGMFAIALYDIDKNKLHLIRDFAGIKPLFFSFYDKELIFGSRYDQISKHPLNYGLNIDKQVLKTYLTMHYIPAPYGILEHTFQVEPGELITIDDSANLDKRYYWRLPKIKEKDLITNQDEAIELINNGLNQAVKNELMADVPLGCFLSGGIDSPLITYFAKQSEPTIKAFCIGSDSMTHDESEDAKKYADLIGCELHLDKMNAKKAADILLESVHHLKEPFADYSIIPTYLLTKHSKKYGTVMLSGDGGDELFFGYERFYSVLKNLKWNFIPRQFRYLVYGIDKLLFKGKHINGGILASSFGEAHKGLHSRFSDDTMNSIFPNLKSISSKTIECYNYATKNNELEMLHSMRNAEFYGMMQKTLAKVDRMSMANSVEVRVPFLKKSFIEAALKIHPKLSYGKHKKKQILKDLLLRLLPKSPINNIKRGFSIPLGKWLQEDLKEIFHQQLFDQNFINTFEISERGLQQLWNEHQTGKKDHKWSIFTLYSLAVWHQQLKE